MTVTHVIRVLNDALALASEGLPCFPWMAKKRPACLHGFLDASTDSTVLRELWARSPGELVGVRTGEASGIDVLDVDAKHQEAVDWCTARRGHFPPCFGGTAR